MTSVKKDLNLASRDWARRHPGEVGLVCDDSQEPESYTPLLLRSQLNNKSFFPNLLSLDSLDVGEESWVGIGGKGARNRELWSETESSMFRTAQSSSEQFSIPSVRGRLVDYVAGLRRRAFVAGDSRLWALGYIGYVIVAESANCWVIINYRQYWSWAKTRVQ